MSRPTVASALTVAFLTMKTSCWRRPTAAGERTTAPASSSPPAAGAGDDLADPVRVGGPRGALLGEAFVVVFVSVQDDIGVGVVEVLPDRREVRVAPVGRARREPRLMPVRKRALVRMRGKVVAEP